MMILITGYPNSGKTTVMNELQKKYSHTFIADEYIKQIYEVNGIGYFAIQQNFGANYVNQLGVDKAKLGSLILQDPKANTMLRAIIWPILRDKLLELKKSQEKYIVEMAIYLVDNDKIFANIFDYVIEIVADFNVDNNKQKFVQLYNQTINKIDKKINNTKIDDTVKQTIAVVDQQFNIHK